MRPDSEILSDIVSYCDRIFDKMDLFGHDIEDLLNDEAYQWCVSFGLAQIGELVKLLSDDVVSRYTDVPWIDISDMRNRLVHSYHSTDFVIEWTTITEDLPVFKDRCLQILDDIESKIRSDRVDSFIPSPPMSRSRPLTSG